MSDQSNIRQLNLDEISTAIHQLYARIGALEAALEKVAAAPDAAAAPVEHVTVLKHIYDWAQRFGMPPLPGEKEPPLPVAPPAPQPRGFDPFARNG